MTGIAVVYRAVKDDIFTAGGSVDYTNSPATADVHKITLGVPGYAHQLQALSPITHTRVYANTVILPDGNAFVTGSVTHRDFQNKLTRETWDSATDKFESMASNTILCNYHSDAILMPNTSSLGWVLDGGVIG